MFAYCGNNPVIYADYSGTISTLIIIALVAVPVYIFVVSEWLSVVSNDYDCIEQKSKDSTEYSEIYNWYTELDVKTFEGNTTNIEFNTGAYRETSINEEYSYLCMEMFCFSAELGILGMGVGAYLLRVANGAEIDLGDKTLEIEAGIDVGFGAEFSLGMKNEIGFTFIVGPSISWEVYDEENN